MRTTLLTLCCWILLVWAHSGRTEPGEVPIALVGGVVIDGNGGIPIEKGTVVIRAGTIVAVGDANSVDVPENAQIVDVAGKAILPGLADMHVHLMGGWDGESGDMLGYQRYLDALLYAGVTTVLDMGNVTPFVVQLRDEIAAGNVVGPRIYCVGPLIDGAAPRWPSFSVGLISESQVPEVIALLERSRVDAVKAYMGLSVPLLDDLVSAATDRSLPVFVDVGDRNGSFEVAALGISAFAHLPTRPLGPSVIALAVDRNIRFVSTLAQQERSARRRLDNLSFLEQPLIADTHPPQFSDALREYATAELTASEESWVARSLIRLQTAFGNVLSLNEAGVLIIAGTDAPYPGVIQGESIHRELELLVEAGLSPLQAISAATGNAAELMGAENWGSIEIGNVADLIIVGGRPDRRISDSRKIHFVMQHGRFLDRDALKFDPAIDQGFGTGVAVD